jgi:type IX secretion system PorP/SprF family membrane protein
MMKIFKFLFVTCVLISSSLVNAQQEVLYTQYMFNEMAINPAYAGNSDALSLTCLARKQWIGLSGSPSTYTFTGHMPVMNKKVGIGLTVFNDKIGVTSTFQSNLAYSYKIRIRDQRISFGLQAAVLNLNQLFNQLDNVDTQDPNFQENINRTMINVGAGFFYEADRYYIGFSVPQMVKNYYEPNNQSGARQLRQYFLTGGYVFYLNRDLKFKPTVLCRYTESLPSQFDLNGSILFREKIWAGLSYRTNKSMNVMLEFLLSSKLKVGWAYDFVASELYKVTNGSAEIMVNYCFKTTRKRIMHPRYF